MMKSYETVWEIFNECANNQMRDVFIDEIELDEDRMEDFLRGAQNQDGAVTADGDSVECHAHPYHY